MNNIYKNLGIAIGLISLIFIGFAIFIFVNTFGTVVNASFEQDGEWKYYRDITIKENSGSILTDYQILVELKGEDFPTDAKSNGEDIRFKDSNGNELNYWIESWNYVEKHAKIWVKVQNIPADSITTIRMYYGNPSTSSTSDGYKTFDYFDLGDKITTWMTGGTGSVGQDNAVGNPPPSYKVMSTSNNYGYMFKDVGLTTNRIVEFDFMTIGSIPVLDIAILVDSKGYGQHIRSESRTRTETSGFSWKDSWIAYQWGAPSGGTREVPNIWYKGKVIISSTQMRGWLGTNEEPTWTIRSSPDNTYIGIEWSGIVDNIRIRKYVPSEPTVMLEAPKSSSLSITKSATPYSIRQFQETTIKVYIKNSGTTDITSVELLDSIHPSLELIRGDFPNPKKYDIIRIGESREIEYVVKAKESGSFNLDPATITYADIEGNIQEVKSDPVSIKVIPSSEGLTEDNPPSGLSGDSAVLLHGEKTDVILGEDILLRLSAVNLINKPPMTVQVILYPPSGMSVTSSEFVKSGAGIFTTTYTLNPGDGKDIEVRIKSNQVGDFDVKGRIVYYFGDDKKSTKDQTLTLPIKVRKELQTSVPIPTKSPGFEIIIGMIILLIVRFSNRYL